MAVAVEASASKRKARERKTAYHHGNLERAMVRLAVELISTHGVEELTLRKLGARLGVSPTAIYRHFSDKEDLMTRLAIEGFVEFTHTLLLAPKPGSPERPIVRMAIAYILFAHERPAYYRVMFGGNIKERRQTEALMIAGERSFAVLSDEVAREIEAGRLRANLNPKQVAVSIWSLLHGFANLSNNSHFDPTHVNVELAAISAIKTLLEGYKA